MARLSEEILQAIKKDDVASFDSLASRYDLEKLRLGRFPLLSLMYLYNSRKILKSYEGKFLKFNSWDRLEEPNVITEDFLKKAGKCLRLYHDEIVSPAEMLVVLDKTARLKRVYGEMTLPDGVKRRMKSAYYIKYGLDIKFNADSITIDRRPLKAAEKRRYLAIGVCSVIILAILIATPVTVFSLVPIRKSGEVTKLKHIDFSSDKTYTLIRDVKVPDDFSVEEVNCNIVGNGKKIIVGENANFGELNGKITDTIFETSGNAIFTACSASSQVNNVTINVKADREIKKSDSFFTLLNYGTMSGITLNVTGKITATGEEGTTPNDEMILAGVALENSYMRNSVGNPNYARIADCKVTFNDFELKGNTSANAVFGGIVGINSGIVQDSEIVGTIDADIFDIGGACYVNGGYVYKVINRANLSQTADTDQWFPLVAGIAVENDSIVEYCQNFGNLTINGAGDATCGGISARTFGENSYCYSVGNIDVTASSASVGGIFGLAGFSENGGYIYIGTAENCISGGKITVSAQETSHVGGIGGIIVEGTVEQAVYDDWGFPMRDENNKVVTETVYWGGGVTNSAFVGELPDNVTYCGGIVGVCGVNVYRKNSYISGGNEVNNFDGNLYVKCGKSSIAATVENYASETAEPEYEVAEGKGAEELTAEEILNSPVYKRIMEELNKDE